MCSENERLRQEIVKKCDDMKRMCDEIARIQILYEILSRLRTLLKILTDLEKKDDTCKRIDNICEMAECVLRELTETVNPHAVFSRIYNALMRGLFGDLDFLQKSLGDSDRADKFIQYIKEDSKPVSKEEREAASREYIMQWKTNNQPSFRSHVGRKIEDEIKDMEREYKNAENQTELIKKKIVDDMKNVIKNATKEFETVIKSISKPTINDIKQDFEPLCHKLRSAKEGHFKVALFLAKYLLRYADQRELIDKSTDAGRTQMIIGTTGYLGVWFSI